MECHQKPSVGREISESLSYNCEVSTLKQRYLRRLKRAEMKFMRRTAECSLLDHKTNEDTLEKLKVDPVETKLAQY
jgi:hypothetical protein